MLGLLLFVGLAAGALVQPVVGAYSDRISLAPGSRWARWGRRQPLILVGLLLTLAFLAGFAFAGNLLLLGLAYLGINVGAGVAQAGTQGLMPDLVPTTQRGSASGLKGLLELSGSLVGFALAGALIKKGQPLGVLLAIGVLLVLGMLITFALVREGRRAALLASAAAPEMPVVVVGPASTLAQQAARERESLPLTASPPSGRSVFVRVLVSRFLFLFGVYGIGHFLLYYMGDRLHLTNAAAATGGLLATLTLVTALVALGGGILSDRVGRLPVIWAAGILSALGALLLIPASSLLTIFLGGAVMGVGSGLFASSNWALTADLTPKGTGGRHFGLLALATSGAAAVAGLLGPLVDAVGYNALFLAATLAFGLSVVVLPRAAAMTASIEVASAS
jgi:MFS family permease